MDENSKKLEARELNIVFTTCKGCPYRTMSRTNYNEEDYCKKILKDKDLYKVVDIKIPEWCPLPKVLI